MQAVDDLYRDITVKHGMRWPAVVAACLNQLDSDYGSISADVEFGDDGTTVSAVIARPRPVLVSYAGGHAHASPPVITFIVGFTSPAPRAPPAPPAPRAPRFSHYQIPARAPCARSRSPPSRRTPSPPSSPPFRIDYALHTPPRRIAYRAPHESSPSPADRDISGLSVPSSPQIPSSQMPRSRPPPASPPASPPAEEPWPSSASSDGFRGAYVSLEPGVENSSGRLIDELAELCTP